MLFILGLQDPDVASANSLVEEMHAQDLFGQFGIRQNLFHLRLWDVVKGLVGRSKERRGLALHDQVLQLWAGRSSENSKQEVLISEVNNK